MRAFVLTLLLLIPLAHAIDVPIHIDWPEDNHATTWPLTVGVPFAPGQLKDVAGYNAVDQNNDAALGELVPLTRWPDGSVRWAHLHLLAHKGATYTLSPNRSYNDFNITTYNDGDSLIVAAGGGPAYAFAPGKAMFSYHGEDSILPDAGDAFYVIDSRDRTGILTCEKPEIVRGLRSKHLVVRTSGDYRDADGNRLARGIVYYTFHAGFPGVKVSHKFIVTEDTNSLWFKEIGMRLPVSCKEEPLATVGMPGQHNQLATSATLAPGSELVLIQETAPHFLNTVSQARVYTEKDGQKTALSEGALAGNHAGLMADSSGIFLQVPHFARTFPKAFRIGQDHITVKLWASESGQELDFRTQSIARNYLGDWVPADNRYLDIPNSATGLARTHDIWILPSGGTVDKGGVELGATDSPIYGYADPAHVAASGVMGPISHRQADVLPEVEAMLKDYFHRSVTIPKAAFPTAGFLYFGNIPFASQPWKQQPDHDNRWAPTLHRLSRTMDYNFRRAAWQLYARSGDRDYFEYAEQSTRFFYDVIFSDHDTPARPLGWMAQGEWHSPIIWGHFDTTKLPADYKPEAYNTNYTLTLASAADVVQFVYDWFLTGDPHAYDMATHWKRAMIKEMDWSVDRGVAFFRPDCYIRMVSAIYELDMDPQVKQYAYDLVHRIIATEPDRIFKTREESGARLNFGKPGEILSAFYYYYISTGDETIRPTLVKIAEQTYRYARFGELFGRGSPLQQCLAIAAEETGDPVYAAYLGASIRQHAATWSTLEDEGIDPQAISPAFNGPELGRMSLVQQAPINVGLPVSIKVAASTPEVKLPFALKSHPTQTTYLLLNKTNPGAARIDVYVNNWDQADYQVKLRDAKGKEHPFKTLVRTFKRVDEPETYDQDSMWIYHHGDHLFLRLEIPATVPQGIYHLDLGERVNWTLLWSDIQQVTQVAPSGLVIFRGHRYYFPVDTAGTLTYFAHRPVQLYDPKGQPITSTSLGKGNWTAPIATTGIYSVETLDDEFTTGVLPTETFFRVPDCVVALGDPSRLFDTSAFALPASDDGYSDAVFGKPLSVSRGSAELALPDGSTVPVGKGTAEFWFSPSQSTSEAHMIGSGGSTHRTQLFVADPIRITYMVDPDNSGRTGRYNLTKLIAEVPGLGYTQANLYLTADRWYHVALTWQLDGKANRMQLFINGRRMTFSHYKPTLKAETPLDKVAPGAATVRLGVGDLYGHLFVDGHFDELRLSNSIRYTDHFVPATQPFVADDATVLLEHFDAPDALTMRSGKLW